MLVVRIDDDRWPLEPPGPAGAESPGYVLRARKDSLNFEGGNPQISQSRLPVDATFSLPAGKRGSKFVMSLNRVGSKAVLVGLPAIGWLSSSLLGMTQAPAFLETRPSCDLNPGILTVTDLPEGSSVVTCDAVGRVVTSRVGAGVTVPAPGGAAGQVGVRPDGSTVSFSIYVDIQGLVSYEENSNGDSAADAWEPEPSQVAELAGSPGACSDAAYKFLGFKEYGTYNWYLGDGPNPAGLSDADIRDEYGHSLGNVTGQHTDCSDYPNDKVSATANYEGKTTRESNMNSDGVCGSKDGTSVWDAKDVGSWLAMTCWWTNSVPGAKDDLKEADVRFITVQHDWTADASAGCSYRYAIRNVGTHEAGHVFGLDDLYGDHANLTMFHASPSCQIRKRTLGKGDIEGLRSLY